jgi:hypothetical protein
MRNLLIAGPVSFTYTLSSSAHRVGRLSLTKSTEVATEGATEVGTMDDLVALVAAQPAARSAIESTRLCQAAPKVVLKVGYFKGRCITGRKLKVWNPSTGLRGQRTGWLAMPLRHAVSRLTTRRRPKQTAARLLRVCGTGLIAPFFDRDAAMH